MRSEVEGRPLLAASLSLVIGISSAWHPLNIIFFILLLAIVIRKSITAVFAALACLTGLLIAPPKLSIATPEASIFYSRAKVVTVPNLTPTGESCVLLSNGKNYQLIVKDRRDLALGQRLMLWHERRSRAFATKRIAEQRGGAFANRIRSASFLARMAVAMDAHGRANPAHYSGRYYPRRSRVVYVRSRAASIRFAREHH